MEQRHNFLTDEWIFVAPERLARPQHFISRTSELNTQDENCPFCPHNCEMIDRYIYISEDKRVCIVPNKYPVASEMSLSGFGIHDVVIETPLHDEKLAFFSHHDIYLYLDSIKQRMLELSDNNKVKYIQVFKNEGLKGGASIYHSHSQILAMPIISKKQNIINSNFKKFYLEHKKCYLCDELNKLADLKIYENDYFVAFSPFASNYAYGLNIAPKNHISDFKDFDSSHLMGLADILKKVLMAYYKIYDNFNYNICFQNAPYNSNRSFNHFYIEIIPRMGQFAGFELSTGCFINPVDVYFAAKTIRGKIDEN